MLNLEKKILQTSGLAITTADNLDDAAKKAVAAAKKASEENKKSKKQ